MKHGLFLFVLGLLSLIAAAQSYPRLLRPDLQWDILHGAIEMCWLTSGDRYRLDGDSVIAGKTYHEVWAWRIRTVNTGPFCPPFWVDTSSTYLDCFLREDTVTGQVFRRDVGGQAEYQLYNYSLSAGDTLDSIAPGISGPFVVDSVRMITLMNGAVVKRFHMNNMEQFTESIGGSQGLQNVMGQGSGDWEVPGCIWDGQTQLWGAACLGLVGVEEALLSAKPWKLVASGNGEIEVQGPEGKVGQLVISDGLGRMVLEAEVRNGQTLKVPSGLLVWNIRWDRAVAGGKTLLRD